MSGFSVNGEMMQILALGLPDPNINASKVQKPARQEGYTSKAFCSAALTTPGPTTAWYNRTYEKRLELAEGGIRAVMSITDYSWQIFEAIKMRRLSTPHFMTPSNPARVDDFRALDAIGVGFHLPDVLAAMRTKHLLDYATGSDQQIQDIVLTGHGEQQFKEYVSATYYQSHAPDAD